MCPRRVRFSPRALWGYGVGARLRNETGLARWQLRVAAAQSAGARDTGLTPVSATILITEVLV